MGSGKNKTVVSALFSIFLNHAPNIKLNLVRHNRLILQSKLIHSFIALHLKARRPFRCTFSTARCAKWRRLAPPRQRAHYVCCDYTLLRGRDEIFTYICRGIWFINWDTYFVVGGRKSLKIAAASRELCDAWICCPRTLVAFPFFERRTRREPIVSLAPLHSRSLTNCLVGHNLNLVEGDGQCSMPCK